MSSRTDEQQNQNLLLSENKQPYINISPSPPKKKKKPHTPPLLKTIFFLSSFLSGIYKS